MARVERTADDRIKFWKNVQKNGLNRNGEPMNNREKLHVEAKLKRAENDKKNGYVEKLPFVPMQTEEKIEYGNQFTAKEKESYRKGKKNAYRHMANIARNESSFISDNLTIDKR